MVRYYSVCHFNSSSRLVLSWCWGKRRNKILLKSFLLFVAWACALCIILKWADENFSLTHHSLGGVIRQGNFSVCWGPGHWKICWICAGLLKYSAATFSFRLLPSLGLLLYTVCAYSRQEIALAISQYFLGFALGLCKHFYSQCLDLMPAVGVTLLSAC